MIQSILSNLAVILLSHLAVTTLLGYRERFSRRRLQFYIVILMSITVISMFYLPIQFSNYRLDLRLIPLIMLAIFSGWHITMPVLVIACIWRYFLGGDGAIPGIVFGMSLPTIFALVYMRIIGNRKKVWDIFVLITICWFISDIPLIFYPYDGLEILKQIGFLRFSSFLLATFIYYTIIEIENGRLIMKQQLEFLATHDQLTKLLTRQECIRRAEIKHKMNEKNTHHFMVMIDVDHFKELNDEYGHAAGDDTLVELSEILKSFEKDTLQAARYGGEEFLLWICIEDKDSITQTVAEIQEKIRHTHFEVGLNQAIPITVSIGIASWPTGTSIHDAIKEADRKLYIAKDQGRNQMIV